MNKRHPYNNIIERKLEQLPAANADLLWIDMHSILDKKMPQKKGRRRFIAWWSFTGRGLFMLMFVSLMITGSSLFFLAPKKSDTVAIKKLPGSQRPDKFIEAGEAKVAEVSKESITTADETTLKNPDEISAVAPVNNGVDHLINNNPVSQHSRTFSVILPDFLFFRITFLAP